MLKIEDQKVIREVVTKAPVVEDSKAEKDKEGKVVEATVQEVGVGAE